jgi:hypothetical protein
MLIALDYDGTYTADPSFWDRFIAAARAGGHRVFIVTMRFPFEGADLDRLRSKVDRVVFTCREAKGRHLFRLGHDVDVWIDNHPHHIVQNASPGSSKGVPRIARWRASVARAFRFLWPEKPPQDAR